MVICQVDTIIRTNIMTDYSIFLLHNSKILNAAKIEEPELKLLIKTDVREI